MSQLHVQKFETSMFEYCSTRAEQAYRLIEDGETTVGLSNLGHLADVLQMLVNSKNSSGVTSIDVFAKELRDLSEIDKDAVYTHLQENGFGQHIAE